MKRNLSGELSAEAIAKEDDGVGLHEMAEARSSACNLQAWFPWIFDGSYSEIRLILRREKEKRENRGFWFCVVLFFLFRGSNQNRSQKERKKERKGFGLGGF